VLVTALQWPSLDPALNTQAAADATLNDAVFGGLFQFATAGKATQVIPDEATSYKVLNGGMTFEVILRHGLKFSNGDPMNAAAVVTSIDRDLLPANACICAPNFTAVSSVAASGQYTVVLNLSHPFPPLIYSFDNTAPNWTADAAALAQESVAAFGQDPIGAGPFEIVSNQASATLTLQANPHYWLAGHPLVKNLTFESIGSDQSAYESLTTGQSQIAVGISTVPLVQQAKAGGPVKVLTAPATGYNFVEMNNQVAPFNNILAREAIMYATDPGALTKSLYGNLFKVVESATAPGETIYLPKIPNYRTYDVNKAKALVAQLGGLTVTLGGLTNTQYWETEQEALASQWGAAGITVHIQINSLQNYLQELGSNNWQALDTNWAAIDPALGLPSHFSSTAPLSGVKDPIVDSLMVQGAATVKYGNRVAIYTRLFEQMTNNADVAFLYSKPAFTMYTRSVHGEALIPEGAWESVS